MIVSLLLVTRYTYFVLKILKLTRMFIYIYTYIEKKNILVIYIYIYIVL